MSPTACGDPIPKDSPLFTRALHLNHFLHLGLGHWLAYAAITFVELALKRFLFIRVQLFRHETETNAKGYLMSVHISIVIIHNLLYSYLLLFMNSHVHICIFT